MVRPVTFGGITVLSTVYLEYVKMGVVPLVPVTGTTLSSRTRLVVAVVAKLTAVAVEPDVAA